MTHRTYTDPVTGDPLTLGEVISWHVQGVIRRWSFLGVVTFATLAIWIHGQIWKLTVTDIWNLCASFLAIAIETIVGLALFSQTKRDAQVLREIRAIARRIESLEQRELEDIESITQQGGTRATG